MKILLTGGAGFIGSHIAEALLEANYEVIIVDNLITGNEENIPSGAKFYNRDICLSIDDIFVLEKPDYVIHQAAQVSVGKSLESPIDDAQINILATINLLDACVKYKIKKFILHQPLLSTEIHFIYQLMNLIPHNQFHFTDCQNVLQSYTLNSILNCSLYLIQYYGMQMFMVLDRMLMGKQV